MAALLLAALDAFAHAEGSTRSLRSSWRTRTALAHAALAVLQVRACAQGRRGAARVGVFARAAALPECRALKWTGGGAPGTGRGQDEVRCALQIHADVEGLAEGPDLGDDWVAKCQAAVAGLLQDDAYAARCVAARLVPRLFPLFLDLQARAPAFVTGATVSVG